MGAGGTSVNRKTGVAPDYINAWMGLSWLHPESPVAEIEESYFGVIPHYEDYVTEQNYPEVISQSDPAKVACLNLLADSFNTIREQLFRDGNKEAGLAFFELADTLIRGLK